MNVGSGGDSGAGGAGPKGCDGGNGTIAANDCRKRPVREIVGIPADLCKLLSARRNAIKPRYEELVADFQLAHDHEPTTSEQFSLSQRAAFDTREARPEPSSPAQQRAHWRNHATTYLCGQAKLDAMLADTLTARERPGVEITPGRIQSQAAAVIETISKSRSTWERNHVFAEAQRSVRTEGAALDPRVAVAITDTALQEPHSIPRPRSAHIRFYSAKMFDLSKDPYVLAQQSIWLSR